MKLTQKDSRKAGFSMIEVMIASVILGVIILITFSILSSSSSHVEAGQVQVNFEEEARRVLEQISKEMRETPFTMLKQGSPSTPVEIRLAGETDPKKNIYPDIEFRKPVGNFSMQAYQLNPLSIYSLRVRYFVTTVGSGGQKEVLLRKEEVSVDASGAPTGTVKLSTICRSLKDVSLLDPTEVGPLEFWASSATTMNVMLRLERPDPKNSAKPKLFKTVETTIDLRN